MNPETKISPSLIFRPFTVEEAELFDSMVGTPACEATVALHREQRAEMEAAVPAAFDVAVTEWVVDPVAMQQREDAAQAKAFLAHWERRKLIRRREHRRESSAVRERRAASAPSRGRQRASAGSCGRRRGSRRAAGTRAGPSSDSGEPGPGDGAAHAELTRRAVAR